MWQQMQMAQRTDWGGKGKAETPQIAFQLSLEKENIIQNLTFFFF